MIIKKISSATLLFAIFIVMLSSCSIIEKNPSYKISNQYNVLINRDFWGIPYIKGQTDQDVAYGIGLVHAEDAYDDLVELMPLYRGENALYNGLDGIDTDYLVRLLKVHSKVENIGKKQLSQNILAMAQAYADGVNMYANLHPEKVNLSIHPVSKEDVLAGSYIQHLFFAGLDRDLAQMASQDKTSIPTGSNAIAINSIKADANASYLLINSHQPLSGPVGWYELNIESKSGWHGHGGNFPGSFLINVGFNKDIGWGATVNRPDVTVDTWTISGTDIGSDTLTGFKRIEFNDGVLALDIDAGDTAGQAYRLYQAAFARTPDMPGVSYHMNDMESNGLVLENIANNFIASPEFKTKYGDSPSDDEFIDLLYQNVLGRSADDDGLAYYTNHFNEGTMTRAAALIGFAESPENVTLVAPQIEDGIWLAS